MMLYENKHKNGDKSGWCSWRDVGVDTDDKSNNVSIKRCTRWHLTLNNADTLFFVLCTCVVVTDFPWQLIFVYFTTYTFEGESHYCCKLQSFQYIFLTTDMLFWIDVGIMENRLYHRVIKISLGQLLQTHTYYSQQRNKICLTC